MEMRTMLVVVVDVEEFPGTELGPGDESHISHGRENKTIILTTSHTRLPLSEKHSWQVKTLNSVPTQPLPNIASFSPVKFPSL